MEIIKSSYRSTLRFSPNKAGADDNSDQSNSSLTVANQQNSDLSNDEQDSHIPVNPNSRQSKHTTETEPNTDRKKIKCSGSESRKESPESINDNILDYEKHPDQSGGTWKLEKPLKRDDEGFVVLPQSPHEVAYDWGCVKRAKAIAVRATQRFIVEEADDPVDIFGFEHDEDGEFILTEQGERIVIDGRDNYRSGSESEMFAKDGPLPLKKLRDIAIYGEIFGGFLSQEEYNKVLEGSFCSALKDLLKPRPAKR